MTRALGMHELLVGVAVLALFGALLFFSPRLYGYSLMEDLPLEWFQFFCLAAAAWWWGKGAARRWKTKAWLGFVLCCALAALSAFVAGEEISWGHRVFGYETPAYFAHRNVQNEPTIHNLARQLVEPRGAAIAVMLGYGIVLPLLAWGIRPFGRWMRRAQVPVPNPGTAIVFALAIWLMKMPFTATDDEVGEGFFAMGLLFSAFTAGGVSGSSLLRWVGILAAVSLVASALCMLRPAHREQVGKVGHLKAAQAYEGLGMRHEAAREYEGLARYWKTDWELWCKVITLYYEAGDLKKAFDISAEFITINKRVWRPFEVMAEIGRIWGMEDEVRRRIRDVLIDEPYNDYARWALLIVQGRRPFHGEEVEG